MKNDFKVLANNFTENLLTATFKGFLVVSGQKLIMSNKCLIDVYTLSLHNFHLQTFSNNCLTQVVTFETFETIADLDRYC